MRVVVLQLCEDKQNRGDLIELLINIQEDML